MYLHLEQIIAYFIFIITLKQISIFRGVHLHKGLYVVFEHEDNFLHMAVLFKEIEQIVLIDNIPIIIECHQKNSWEHIQV